MKLFLTSAANQVMDKIASMLSKPASEYKLAFIPTASDPNGNNKPWADADRASLIEVGFQVTDYGLRDKREDEVRTELSKYDIIFVAGGNPFYLLDQARKSGFIKIAEELTEQGVIYIGSSAGSYLACPTVETGLWKSPDKNRIGLKDFTALGFVDFLIFAHFEPKYEGAFQTGKRTTKYPVITLTDKQFVFWEDGDYKVIEV